jgi:DNA/RNA endonuclease G (NUC1)
MQRELTFHRAQRADKSVRRNTFAPQSNRAYWWSRLKTIGRIPFANVRLLLALLLLHGVMLSAWARIGVPYQMPLGNPSGAAADPNNHGHFLIQRSVFAMDYDDSEGEPNWVSWNLTADDLGPAKRSAFHTDNELPASFRHVTDADYKGSGFDRGHMCPSADRTDNAQDNAEVFAMSNISPQAPDNNQGVWEKLEAECRELARAGNELLILCGPAGATTQHINGNGPVAVPTHTWKIVVQVPNGPGSVLDRISASTRVIAVSIPNVAGVRRDPWTKYLVSVSQLEALTGLKFFTALAPEIAQALKSKVDGHAVQPISPQPAPVATAPTPTVPAREAPAVENNWVAIGLVVGIVLLIGFVVVVVVIFKMRPKK